MHSRQVQTFLPWNMWWETTSRLRRLFVKLFPSCFHDNMTGNVLEGCNSVGRESDRHAADAGSIPRCGKGFSPWVHFQCRLSYGVPTPPCAIACSYICAHVKDPVVHVRVWWIMKTLKKQTPTMHRKLGSATLSQLAFPGESNPSFHLRNPS